MTQLKSLKKEQWNDLYVPFSDGNYKTRAELNEYPKTNPKNQNKARVYSLKKINQIDKTLERLTKKWRAWLF